MVKAYRRIHYLDFTQWSNDGDVLRTREGPLVVDRNGIQF